MKILTKKEGDKIYVDVELTHIKGTRKKPEQVMTKHVMAELSKRGHSNLVAIKESVVYNYQTLERCRGSWVFQDLDVVEARKLALRKIVEITEEAGGYDKELEKEPKKTKKRKRTTKKKKSEE
jgi:hypothetical protein